MEILIMPTIEHLREIHGIDEFDEEMDDALLFEQGYEGVPVEIEDGEYFKIPENHIGRIIDDEEYYFFVGIMDDEIEKELANDCDIIEGHYLLEGDIIKAID